MITLEPIQLHLGEPQRGGIAVRKWEVLDPDERPVGLLFDDTVRNIFLVTFYGTSITVRSFKQEEVLEVCGLWLAYQKSIKP